MMGIALSMLGIGKRVMGWLSAGFKWIFADIHRLLIAALLCVCVWFYIGWGVEATTSETRRVALVAAKQAISDMKAANKQATEFAEAEKRRIETENERKAENAKRDYETRLASVNGNLARWMRDNANRASQADMPRASEGTSGPVDPGGAPELPERYAVTGRDLELTAQAFAKLEAVQGYLASIQATE